MKQVTQVVAQLRAPTEGELPPETREAILAKIPELDGRLGVVETEAGKLRDEARAQAMKSLERGADSLEQSLRAVRKKLGSVVGQPLTSAAPSSAMH